MNQTVNSAPLDPAPAAPLARSARLGRTGIWLLMAGLLLLIIWAATAPLDEGVPTQAMVAIDTKRKAVQHLQGGIVREVLVREGDPVKEGQVLVKLDDAATKANFEATRQRYLALRAMEARLMSEQSGRERIEFGAELRAAASDPLIARHLAAQEQLFSTRRSALRADLQAIEESVRGQEAAIQTYGGVLDSRSVQRRLLQEQWSNISGLVKEGYAPRNQQLDLERQVAEVTAVMTDLQGSIARAKQSIAELRQRSLSRQQDYRKETDSQLAEVAREVQSDEGRFRALREDLERTVIKSPATGQVVGLAFQTVGGVVPPGQRLMDIVPEKEDLLLEARIPPHLIDAVQPGQKTDVRFSSFAHSPQLVVQGEVKSVSADLLAEQTPQGAMSFFLARIQLTPEGMTGLGKHQIQPGMPAEVIIRTGERTVLTYLLHPLTRRVASSMKEQ
ncbi:MAG: HlyD family type I secretion periplasmic adaptor subunit [Betaproteobacteria bacterium]